MTSRTDLKVWANTLDVDGVTNDPQRWDIIDDLWEYGWLREVPVVAQDINQLLYLITDVVKNDTLSKVANLSDVPDKVAARNNLNLLDKSSNLSDIPDKAAARTNLDLLQKSSNLGDVPNKSLARDNLGLNIDTLYNNFFDKIYPLGTIYTVIGTATNPSSTLGRGTWVATGAGRVLIGVGTGTDANGVTKTITSGQASGEYVHTQTLAELAAHSHTLPVRSNPNSGDGFIEDADSTASVQTASTGSSGSSTPFNVSQPSLGVYFWQRTA